MQDLAILAAGALLAFLVVLGVLIALLSRRKPRRLPVVARRLMTDRERAVIASIEEAMPNCRVHAQVAMAALLDAKKDLSRNERVAVRNSFDRKMVDFVLEERATGNVLAIIELDDRTHDAAKDQHRDTITTAAGYRTIRLAAGSPTDSVTIRTHIVTAVTP